MKTSILFSAVLLCVTISNAQWKDNKIIGNGNMTTVTRSTSDYDGIKCSGTFDYVLVSGKEGKITIEGEENILEYIITEVKGNDLIVKTKNNVNLNPSRNKNIKITIPFKDINNVTLGGSGNLWSEDKITATDLYVTLSGSGQLALNIEATSTKGNLSGSGVITLKGSTNSLVAKVSGSGEFHGFDLQANNTTVSIAGSGEAEVVSNESLKARVAGSGEITYKGSPKTEDTKVAGSGSISK